MDDIDKFYIIISIKIRIMCSKEKNWRNEFFDNYFKNDKNDDKCIQLRNSKLTNLFQYTSVKYAIDLISNDLIYLREIKNLNDPFEGDLLYDIEDFFIKNPNRKKDEIEISLKKLNDEIKDYVFISCFAEDNKITPMWNHYADFHNGICIEYDLNKNKKFKEIFFPIAYIDEERNKQISKKLINDKENLDYGKISIEVFTNKSKYWEYEKEWRIIILKNNPEDFFKIISQCGKNYLKFIKPKAVYLGYKISESDACFIKNLCDLRDIPVYKMIKDYSSFNLKCEKI